MTVERNPQNQINPEFQGVEALNSGNANQLMSAMNMHKRDRFELLSAYLDGEVTAAQRREVEEWLAKDQEIQGLYARLLKLRQELRTIPVPPAQQPVEQTVQQVYLRMERRSRRRRAVWGGSAIAALFIGALSNVLPSHQFLQLAKSPESATEIEPLKVALNTPVVEIPKAATAPPEKPSNQIESPRPAKDFN